MIFAKTAHIISFVVVSVNLVSGEESANCIFFARIVTHDMIEQRLTTPSSHFRRDVGRGKLRGRKRRNSGNN